MQALNGSNDGKSNWTPAIVWEIQIEFLAPGVIGLSLADCEHLGSEPAEGSSLFPLFLYLTACQIYNFLN